MKKCKMYFCVDYHPTEGIKPYILVNEEPQKELEKFGLETFLCFPLIKGDLMSQEEFERLLDDPRPLSSGEYIVLVYHNSWGGKDIVKCTLHRELDLYPESEDITSSIEELWSTSKEKVFAVRIQQVDWY